MAKPNYAFDKRQRELEKKRKKAEKSQRKLDRTDEPAVTTDDSLPEAATPADADQPPESTGV